MATIDTIALSTDASIAREAAEALRERDRIAADLRCADLRLRTLTASYARAVGCWGFSVHHLRMACKARGLL
jgi:hypothetical protein